MASPLSQAQFSGGLEDPSQAVDGHHLSNDAFETPPSITGPRGQAGDTPEPHDSQTQTSLGKMFSWRRQGAIPLTAATQGTFMRPQ